MYLATKLQVYHTSLCFNQDDNTSRDLNCHSASTIACSMCFGWRPSCTCTATIPNFLANLMFVIRSSNNTICRHSTLPRSFLAPARTSCKCSDLDSRLLTCTIRVSAVEMQLHRPHNCSNLTAEARLWLCEAMPTKTPLACSCVNIDRLCSKTASRLHD